MERVSVAVEGRVVVERSLSLAVPAGKVEASRSRDEKECSWGSGVKRGVVGAAGLWEGECAM